MRRAPVLAALLVASCVPQRQLERARPPLPAPVAGARELHAKRCADVVAHWSGQPPEVQDDGAAFPPEFGVRALWFTFDGEEVRRTFLPRGELFFSDWTFEVFSPSCKHVALLQDHYGPYHLIRLANLRSYLSGTRPPDAVARFDSQTAVVHCRARWVSDHQFVFHACGETEQEVRMTLP